MPASPYFGHGPEHLELWLGCPDVAGFVYIIKAENSPPIKVGYAKDVQARIASLQTGNAFRLELLHVLPGDQRLEWHLHRQFKRARVRGEWFDGPGVLDPLRFIADLADRMVAAYQATGVVPDYRELEQRRFTGKPKTKRHSPVTVRWVEPDPKVPTEVAAEMRRSVQGCSPSLYLGPPHPEIFKDISPNPEAGY